MSRAISRQVSRSIGECELTHLHRAPIDVEEARRQHDDYVAALERCGIEVTLLPPLDEHPDAVFVEDTAVVLDEVIILTRPGAATRRAEVDAIEPVLAALRPVRRIGRGTIDGGDVLRVGRRIYVGITARTDGEGRAALQSIAGPLGYDVVPVEVTGCLHLKTAATATGNRSVILNPAWVDRSMFSDLDIIEIDGEEPFAANVVRAGEAIIASSSFPRTVARLRDTHEVITVDASELAKAEGGLTCCSILIES